MKTILLIIVSMAACYAQIPPKDVQIKTAVLAAPQELRGKAMVYGYSDKGEFIVLQNGANEMVCIADDPTQSGFSVSCYHKDLEPFMARGRELKKQGKTHQDIFTMREAEVKDGKLVMPKQPSSLYVYSTAEEKYNKTTGEIQDGYLRYVIYIPYATAESKASHSNLKHQACRGSWILVHIARIS
jgi:hypothetical protein